jgi:hypothetical protein
VAKDALEISTPDHRRSFTLSEKRSNHSGKNEAGKSTLVAVDSEWQPVIVLLVIGSRRSETR